MDGDWWKRRGCWGKMLQRGMGQSGKQGPPVLCQAAIGWSLSWSKSEAHGSLVSEYSLIMSLREEGGKQEGERGAGEQG